MPELPEVETTVRDLNIIVRLFIKKIVLNRKNIRYPIPAKITTVTKNSKIMEVIRIGKYIVINLDSLYSIIIHLGMSGRLKLLEDKVKKEKHDHVEIYLKNNKKIVFNDPRRFGILDIIKTKEIKNSKYFISLGLDPFDKKFTKKYLYEKLGHSNKPIKLFLLDQKIISGIGNIYASEILYDSKLSPFKISKTLTIMQIKKLRKSILNVLKNAIKNKGSSLKDYSSIHGTLGNYQNKFLVYNNEGKCIVLKKTATKIIKVTQNGRSTFYCPYFQKN